MAGGIFVDQPFHFNPKCVVFSVVLIIGYWFLPPKQPALIPIIFITAYIAMAWYDYLYNCDTTLYSGTSPIGAATFDAWGKPQLRTTKHSPSINLHPNQEQAYQRNINYFHIFGVFPFFVVASYFGIQAIKKQTPLNRGLQASMFIVALWVIAYHTFRLLFKPRYISQNPQTQARETANLKAINILHLIAVAPLLLYLSIRTTNATEFAWYSLGTLGFLAFVYHLFRVFFPRKQEEPFQQQSPKLNQIARSLARQSARYSNASLQDENPLIAALHASYGSAYLFALYENFPPNTISTALNNQSPSKFRTKVQQIQDNAFTNLTKKCPSITPGDPLLSKVM